MGRWDPEPPEPPKRGESIEQQTPKEQTTAPSDIGADFPFESRFAEVDGSKMHYVDEPGEGDETFLLIHGTPTSSYLWRNVIPHLKRRGRVVALDLIGMGHSDKPDIGYRLEDHIAYADGFVEKLGLRDVVLVLHDWGGPIGFDHARRNPANVRGLVFFETLVGPVPEMGALPPSFRDFLKLARSGGEGDDAPGSGWDALVNKNVMVERVLPGGVVRRLAEEEMARYRAPFAEARARKPLWMWPREVPIAGQPAEAHNIVSDYSAFLRESPLPKLLLYATPGLNTSEQAALSIRDALPNTAAAHVGEGLHFLQEDRPREIGRAIQRWVGASL